MAHLSNIFADRPRLQPAVWTTDYQDRLAPLLLPPGQRYVALAPTANWEGKVWPARHFVALAQRLMAKGFKVAVFYGPGPYEKRLAEKVLQDLPEALDMGGIKTIGLVASLLRRCSLFVGNDSGLMHLAAAAGTPTLGLFGPSCSSEYAPVGKCTAFVSAPGIEGRAHIQDLTVNKVLEAAEKLVGLKEQSLA